MLASFVPARFGAAVSVVVIGSAPWIGAQSFANNTSDIPSGSSNSQDSENIDFADVDLDGDWDAAIANGGDIGADQNRLWINFGGLQGGVVGTFVDDTAARFPVLNDPCRDIEFADIDGDSDPDLYIPGSSQILNVPSRWWVNLGGDQGGSAGFFADETSSRWVGLGGTGSSLAPFLVLPGGGFVDWSGDADFADLDNDGDLDLVHSSYGGAFGGQVPTRLFLNDGDGFFSEFNPSGFQLTSANISNGDPGLWCDGVQFANTTDVTGAQCDIAEEVVDFELGDTDGDFDVDIVLAGRSAQRPRFYRNKLSESGTLGFRDQSGLAFPGITLGGATFDTELGDLDNDDDLDLYGLNWSGGGFSFSDATLENVGGVFINLTTIPGSSADEEEGDFVDYDNDGDLDLFVANFSGADKLYENAGGNPITYSDVSASELPGTSGIGRDIEIADVDNDGDYDAFVANSNFGANIYYENVTDVPDSTAPRIPALEDIPAPVVGPGVAPVRCRIFDNVGYYTLWYYPTELVVLVDTFELPALPMTSSRGSIFRGELPANLVGDVVYRVRTTDFSDNSTLSSPQSYSTSGDTGTLFGAESAATGATPPTIRALSEAHEETTLYLAGEGIAGAFGYFGIATAALAPPVSVPGLPNLVLNIDPSATIAAVPVSIDGSGRAVLALDVPPSSAGITVHAQFLDVAGDGTFGSSQGLSLTIQ
ncbi:MAG: VCBS repeat-containing protein [Planctomycetota bacterium]